MEDQVIFKSQWMGFNKKEVLSFIDASSLAAQQAEEKLNTQIDTLTAARKSLEDQVSAFAEKMNGLEQKLEQEKETVLQLTGKVDELTEKVEEQNTVIQQKEKELEEREAQNQKLRLKTDLLEEQSAKYDQVASRLGKVLLDAESSAERILQEAKESAAIVASEKENTLSNLSIRLDELKTNISSLKSDIYQTMSTIEFNLDNIAEEIDFVKEKLIAPKEKDQIVSQMQSNRSERISQDNLLRFFR